MSWIKKLGEILKMVDDFKSSSIGNYVVFRGQANVNWNLDTTLKLAESKIKREYYFEYDLYFDFITNAKGYINNQMHSWEIITEMRHFGLPVRILDWTESLNAALYFAIKDSKINQNYSDRKDDAALYILDPFALNSITLKENRIYNPLEKSFVDFENIFFDKKIPAVIKNKFKDPFSVIMPRRTERISAQKGLFTVQGINNKSIDKIDRLKLTFRKINIEKKYFEQINSYLDLTGISHFTIYPDFEGLAMFLKEVYNI
jgi:hypothetical protein